MRSYVLLSINNGVVYFQMIINGKLSETDNIKLIDTNAIEFLIDAIGKAETRKIPIRTNGFKKK